MSNRYGPRIVTDGLVLCLDAADRNSYPGTGTSWGDLSGNVNSSTFTLSNSPVFSNNSFTFDGINDYASSTNSNHIKWENWTQLTFNIVFKHISATGQTSARQYLLDFRTNGGINGALGVFVDNPATIRELTLFYNTTGTSYEEPTVATYDLNEWIDYTFTFDKTTSTNNIKHYINGVNVFNRSVTANSTTTNGDGTVWIAKYGGSDGFYFNGVIPTIKAYDRILSASEVLQNYNATKGRFGL